MNAIRVQLDDDILLDSCLLVLGFLLVQVVVSAGTGDLDDELRRTDDETALDVGSGLRAPPEFAGDRPVVSRRSDPG